jgi:diphthamide biosynthesis methyltransferase
VPLVVSETCLYFIGMGLSGFQTCSLETVEILKKADEIFIENYTNFISEKIPHELKQVKTKFSYLKREDLEADWNNLMNSDEYDSHCNK